MLIAALFTIANKLNKLEETHFKLKEPKFPSTDEWIKMWYIYTMEYYSAIKRTKYCHLQQHGWT